MRPELVRRAEITQKTLDRYSGMAFRYGRGDCVQMAAFHLKGMGHRVLLSKGGRYTTALGAAKALRRAGFANVSAALDAMGLERIPPAAALVGDIVSVPTDAPIECLMVMLGNGAALGWMDAEGLTGAVPIRLTMFETAWRVPCLGR